MIEFWREEFDVFHFFLAVGTDAVGAFLLPLVACLYFFFYQLTVLFF